MIARISRAGMGAFTTRLLVPVVAAGSLALAGPGVARAATPPGRSNATAACGSSCDDISSLLLGPGTIMNAYISGMTGLPGRGGQVINMRYASNSDPNEDIEHHRVGVISDFCRSAANPGGILPANSVACLDYRTRGAFELDFVPYGGESGYCLGTRGRPAAGAGLTVRLIPCGLTAGSIFTTDPNHMHADDLVLISAATTTFSHPAVLTVQAGSSHPGNQVMIEPENLLTGGAISDSQQFSATNGPAA